MFCTRRATIAGVLHATIYMGFGLPLRGPGPGQPQKFGLLRRSGLDLFLTRVPGPGRETWAADNLMRWAQRRGGCNRGRISSAKKKTRQQPWHVYTRVSRTSIEDIVVHVYTAPACKLVRMHCPCVRVSTPTANSRCIRAW